MIRRLVWLCGVSLAVVSASGGTQSVAQELPTTVATCTADGSGCRVGSIGPGGGVVYYDAGSMQWWGRFLEAQLASSPASGPWGGLNLSGSSHVRHKAIGMGSVNSAFMLADATTVFARVRGSVFGNYFHLPSKDELDALYNYWKISGDTRLNYASAPVWTSSEASATFAWYQLFQDGTQFTDANGIIRGSIGNKTYLRSPVHVGSAFKPIDFQVIGVRAFPDSPTTTGEFNWIVHATSNNLQCSNGGANTICNVGDIGPGGGIVFYDAGKDEYWGRYLEIAPKSCESERLPWRPTGNRNIVYNPTGSQSAAELRVLAKGLGMGRVNTRVITLALGSGAYAAKFAEDMVCGGKDDWFLPSKDELDLAFNRLAQNRVGGNDSPVGGFNKGFYWTSTDYNNTTAWTQYFMDGQQFDRVQTLSGNRNPPTPFRTRAVRAFGRNNTVVACMHGGVCRLGDIGPGGGIVFYVARDSFLVNGVGNRYLEFANTLATNYISFCPGRERVPLNLGTRPYVGAGFRNTALLRMNCNYSPSLFDGGGGKSDWFIPSIDELNLLRNFITSSAGDLNGFVDLEDFNHRVWSSTESGDLEAYTMGRRIGESVRDRLHGVRLIRAFG